MGTRHWAVQGFGIQLENQIFDKPIIDITKAVALCRDGLVYIPNYAKIEEDTGITVSDTWQAACIDVDVDLQEFIEVLSDKGREEGRIPLECACTDSADNGMFLMYAAGLPWQQHEWDETHRDINEDQMRILIADIIRPYLDSSRDEGWLMEAIGYINTYGCDNG